MSLTCLCCPFSIIKSEMVYLNSKGTNTADLTARGTFQHLLVIFQNVFRFISVLFYNVFPENKHGQRSGVFIKKP